MAFADPPYADRIADMATGTDPSNQYKLDATTHQSAAVDTLFGELDTDWFLVDDPSEFMDLAVGEIITDLT